MKIAIIGYGKMGKTIEQIAKGQGHEIGLIVDQGDEWGIADLEGIEVAIEFTRPEAAVENIKKCLEAGVAVVSGTTGWLAQLEEVKGLCAAKEGAMVYASNYSIGVNLFFVLNEYLAELMNAHPAYRPSMEEIHHTQKLDAPSGTAITLAEGILNKVNGLQGWVTEAKEEGAELGIVSKRIDKVLGTHAIQYQSSIDEIEIKHTAHSREGFAKGAVHAAEWVVGKKGFFSMRDVLGL